MHGSRKNRYSKYKHLLKFRVWCYVVIYNKTRARIANPPNSAQLEGHPIRSYIRVHAVVWECGEAQTGTQTDRRPWLIYISPPLRLTRNVIMAWEGIRRSGVALAMRHRLKWFIQLRAQWLGDEHPA